MHSDVLPLLANGEWRSGQDLADTLGVSRTAVWKQVQQLQRLALRVESARGRGYRIVGGVDLLNPEAVNAALTAPARALLEELLILPQLDSTNAEAMRRIAAGTAGRLVCTAEQQSAGRGRRGRDWVSPFASNLYISAVAGFAGGAAALEGLSLAVGVAVAEALAEAGAPELQLKWPNDLVHNGSKLGGILLEMAGDAAGPCQVVVGVGINVAMPQAAADAIDQRWTDLRTLGGGRTAPRSQLLATVLNHLLPALQSFDAQGFAPWRERWQARDAFANRAVLVTLGEQPLAGTARGVDERGALQLETTTGLRSVYAGEVSLRAAS